MATLPVLRPTSNSGATVSGATLGLYSWVSGTTWSNNGAEPFAPAGYPDRLLQPVTTSPATGDNGLALAPAANTTAIISMGLDDTPADFVSMDSLSIRYSSAQFGTRTDDTGYLSIWIITSGGVGLAGFSSVDYLMLDLFFSGTWNGDGSQGGTATAPAYNKTNTFDYLNTSATKADWDTAVARVAWGDTRNMASDASSIILVDFQLEGTYTPMEIPNKVTQLTRPAVQRSANW